MTPVAVLASAATVSFGVSAAQAGKHRGPVLHVQAPAPGHVTIMLANLAVTKTRAAHQQVRFTSPRLLPPSTRVLTVSRLSGSEAKRKLSIVVIAIDQAHGSSAPPSTSRKPVEPLTFAQLLSREVTRTLVAPGRTFLADIVEKKTLQDRLWEAVNADLAQPYQLKPLMPQVRKLFSIGPGGELPRGTKTNHYDDGHAFGWKVNSKSDERDFWKGFAKSAPLSDLLDDIESRIGADINGDGKVATGGTTPQCMRAALRADCPPTSGAVTGSGSLSRDSSCAGDPQCNQLDFQVSFNTPFSQFKVVLPPNYVGGGENAFVNGNQAGYCSYGMTTTRADTIFCTMSTTEPAGTQVTFTTGTAYDSAAGTVTQPLPSGSGADLYLLQPKSAGPFRMSGP